MVVAEAVWVLFGETVSKLPLKPTVNLTNSSVLLMIFLGTNVIMSPLFIIFGGLLTIVLGIFYYVVSYGGLFFFGNLDNKIIW
jgi:hypothetical protein